jgi:hypothetical protein
LVRDDAFLDQVQREAMPIIQKDALRRVRRSAVALND